jgi:hypothetical protein
MFPPVIVLGLPMGLRLELPMRSGRRCETTLPFSGSLHQVEPLPPVIARDQSGGAGATESVSFTKETNRA